MATTIPKPTKGRIVLYTVHRDRDVVDESPAVVVGVDGDSKQAHVSLVVFIDGAVPGHARRYVPYDADGKSDSWRYPPVSKETVEVE